MNHAKELARPQKKKADTRTKGGNYGPIPDPTKVEGGTGDTAMWQPEAQKFPKFQGLC